MSYVFRPVDDETILPERIFQGKPWRNISFGTNASVEDYQKNGLYVEVGAKPAFTKYQKCTLVGQVINHFRKEIELQWEITDLSPERVAVIAEQDAKDTERADSLLSNVTLEQGDKWIDTNVVDLASAIVALKKLLRLILART